MQRVSHPDKADVRKMLQERWDHPAAPLDGKALRDRLNWHVMADDPFQDDEDVNLFDVLSQLGPGNGAHAVQRGEQDD